MLSNIAKTVDNLWISMADMQYWYRRRDLFSVGVSAKFEKCF